MSRRVLVIGGTGAFGERLVEGLLWRTDAAVLIGARGVDRAEGVARRLRILFPDRTIESVAIDTATLTAETLRALDLFIVADAAGPFQHAQPATARAAIAAGCHYIDLADARDFVAAFPALDEQAKAAGVVALTGASSTPALSHAALDEITRGWRAIDRVDVAISPGNRAPRGLSVVQAILGRTGKPARVFTGGRWREAPGWGLLIRRRLPGLGKRWLSLVETPDLDLLPQRYAPRDRAIFRAGFELAFMHLGLWLASLPVRIGLLPTLLPLAKPFHWIADRLFRYGTDRGGMIVTASGRDAGDNRVQAWWAVIAPTGDGPNIPTLPALAAVRALLAGRDIAPGARACVDVLNLADIADEFRRFRIVTRQRARPQSLYARVLRDSLNEVPAPIRAGHTVDGRLVLAGMASIEGAANAAGRLFARLFGFPPAGQNIPVRVEMTENEDAEVWTRTFGTRRFKSRLSEAGPGHMDEQFGLVSIRLAVTADRQGVTMRSVSARLGPIPLPAWLTPRSRAIETVDSAGRFTFDVPIAMPLLGQVVRYRGWLKPSTA
ncbi:saccharopine dehydrogenase [Variibacter gotjawalensis]|uniref:Saccharopine dehydrogenase n=1 Tax=Variibacter gotjawalensis TaxID=1333996 RepID=A0A0S3PQ87_9BRAD|nr:SDR family oxidoreductase [Variibacter gotjawalensis]NIK48430.1 hypothetical protein [Variibacter gotjawalensis]RZS50297.1 saccharopine dehydrogenase-like NADP-dependent oxidoreductase [Variibacter gotjawalensis]BAT58130.1 saccharopine dehydrogenase [Variibacter gotjawalensis]